MTAAPPLWSVVGRSPGDLALEDDRRSLTWGELDERTNAVGHGAEAAGLVPGDHVAIVAGNRAEFYEVLLGVQRAGMVVTPLKTGWTPGEIAWVLADAGTRLVVTDTDAGRRAAADAGVPVVDLDGGYEAWLAAQPTAPLPLGRAGVRMSYTSGTTGRPKGVIRPLPPSFTEGFRQQAASADLFHLPADGPHLMVSRVFHGAPLMLSLAALAKGATVRVVGRWDPSSALDALAGGVASTSMVPTMFRQLLALPAVRRSGFSAPALRTVVHGGEPCPVEVKRRMVEWWGPVLVEYFGFTEGGLTVATTEEWLARPGTVGRAVPPREVRVLGPGGEELPPRTEGRVFFTWAGGGRPFSYRNDPDKTERAFVGEAFTAGDIGWVDEDGYLYLSGREADVIVSAGVNVYPAEVEGVLLSLPEVADAAVIGGPDPERGEQVVAVVVPAGGVGGVDAASVVAAVDAACAERLAGYKRPRRVLVRDEVPRDATGKLLRQAIRASLREGAGTGPFAAPPQPRPR